jgi:hypothetical protein
MKSKHTATFPQVLSICAAAALQLIIAASPAWAEKKLAEPVYRVATEATVSAPLATDQAAAAPASPATKVPLDFTQKPGEHPLAPVLRNLKISQDELDNNIRDYSCTFAKREQINGQLGDYQYILLKVMHQPFSVYMSFLKPYTGREVAFVAGQNDGKMVVLEAGFTRLVGKINLDPNGTRAMDGQRHPITDVGIRNLTAKLYKMWDAETKFAECEVTLKPGKKVEGRTTTMVQIVHPIARQNFKFNAARVFFDDELKIPVHFDAFSWPVQAGGDPVLEESYTYAKNLKVNNNFTARDFDSNNNPEIFKK